MRLRRGAIPILLALAGGLAGRLYLAAAFEGNFDQQSWEIISAIMRRGGNVYAETDRLNYSPLPAYLLLVLDHVRSLTGLPSHLVIRGALTAVDLVVAVLVALIARQVAPGRARTALCAYLLNPVAILLVGYHGQLEVLAALPLLVGVWLHGRPRPPHRAWIWLLGSLSLLVKHLLAFQVWMLFTYSFSRLGRIAASALAGAFFVLSFAPFRDAGDEILRDVATRAGLGGLYGFGSLLPRVVSLPLFAAVMTALPSVARDRLALGLPQAMSLSAVVLLATIDGIGNQYFLVPIIFGSFAPSLGYWVFTAVATVFLLASTDNVGILPLEIPWNVVWLAAVAWAIHTLVRPAPRPLLAPA